MRKGVLLLVALLALLSPSPAPGQTAAPMGAPPAATAPAAVPPEAEDAGLYWMIGLGLALSAAIGVGAVVTTSKGALA